MATRNVTKVSVPVSVVEVAHTYASQTPRFNVKIEKNSRGVNFEVSYSGENIDQVLDQLAYAKEQIEARFNVPAENIRVA